MVRVDDWLPIGSVVDVAGAVLPQMVVACVVRDEDGTIWDYAGVPYPQGYVDVNAVVLFGRDSIETVRYVGYQNADGDAYLAAVRRAAPGLYAAAVDAGATPAGDRHLADVGAASAGGTRHA